MLFYCFTLLMNQQAYTSLVYRSIKSSVCRTPQSTTGESSQQFDSLTWWIKPAFCLVGFFFFLQKRTLLKTLKMCLSHRDLGSLVGLERLLLPLTFSLLDSRARRFCRIRELAMAAAIFQKENFLLPGVMMLFQLFGVSRHVWAVGFTELTHFRSFHLQMFSQLFVCIMVSSQEMFCIVSVRVLQFEFTPAGAPKTHFSIKNLMFFLKRHDGKCRNQLKKFDHRRRNLQIASR